MGKIYDVNKLYVTQRINDLFDSIRYRRETERAFRQNGILRSATTHRYAKNYERDGVKFTAMIIVTDQADKRVEAWMDEQILKIPRDKLLGLGIRPVDTGLKYV